MSSPKNNLTFSRAFSGVKYEHLVGGITGGVTSTLILHPLDLLKVRFAVPDSGTLNPADAKRRPQYSSILNATADIWKNEGIKGFYKGVTPNLTGAGAAWGLYFLFYNMVKAQYQGESKTPLGPGKHMLAAAQAGVATLALTNPIWVVKTRLCLQYDNVATDKSTHYRGMTDAFVKTYRFEGIRGLYKGFVPGLFGVSHGALQFMAYEELKERLNRHHNRGAEAKLETSEYLACAAVSKLFAAVTTYPYQVLRARMQDTHATYPSLRCCVRHTYRSLGVKGFYLGMPAYLCHVVPNICLVMLIYEHFNTGEDE